MKNYNLNFKIQENKYFLYTFFVSVLVFFWYINFIFWNNIFINFLFLFIYFYIMSLWIARVLGSYGFKRYSFVFGIFSLFFLISFGMAIPIVVYKIVPLYLFLLLFFLGIVFSIWQKNKSFLKPIKLSISIKNKKLFYFWLILIGIGFLMLIKSRLGDYLRSPWETIPNIYIYVWFLIVFVLGFLSLKKNINIKKFILIFIISSFLMHCFVIIPYEAGFGGDKWRHIGAERSLMEGEIYKPTLFGEGSSYIDIGSLKIPKVLIVGNKTSYSNMWGGAIALSWLTGIDLFLIDLLLGGILFSLFFPFLLLEIVRFFSDDKKFLSISLISSLCFYPLIIYGSITVPRSFGFLLFLFSIILILKYYSNEKPFSKLWPVLLISLPLLYLNYILYLVIFLEILLLSILFKKRKTKEINLIIFLGSIMLVLFFPFLDTFKNMSWFKFNINFKDIFDSFKIFLNNIFVSQPLFPNPYGFEQDGWLYSTMGKNLSNSVLGNLFVWNIILTPFVWLISLFGALKIKKLKKPRLGKMFFIILVISFLGQFIASFFMEGNHIFTKRLVLFISFLFIIFLSWGLYSFLKSNIFLKSTKTIAIILFLSLLSTTVYISGPKFRVVTENEYMASKVLWHNLKEENPPYCVLGNTWPLLSLEAVSGREIITGGFPRYFEYQQPERVQLFYNMNENPSVKYLEKAFSITKAKSCYFMTEKRWLNYKERDNIIGRLNDIMGGHKNIGDVMIWYYKPLKVNNSY